MTIKMIPVGTPIEFLSSDGRWKPGVVVERNGAFHDTLGEVFHQTSLHIRIKVAEDVCIIRPINRCRVK